MVTVLFVLAYAFTLFCAYNIGRLKTQTKILQFIREELRHEEAGEPHVLKFIHKLIDLL